MSKLESDLEARAAKLRAVEARLAAVESTLEKKTTKLNELSTSLDEAENRLAKSMKPQTTPRSVGDDWQRERANAGSSKVKDVRFEDGPNESRVIIEVDGPMIYAGSNLTPTMKLLALEGAEIGQQLERSLDASGFGGPVRMVTSFKEQDTVKVIVAMREDAAPRLEEQPGRLVLHFPRSKPRAKGEVPSNRVVSVASQQVAGFATAPAAMATRSSKRSRSKWRGERIDLEIQDAPIKDILLMFSDIGRINIISGDGVAGQVTMRLNSVPWDQALDIILRSLKLGMVQEGNIIRVATLAELEDERAKAIERANAQVRLKPLETRLIPLSYATVAEMSPKVAAVLSSRGSVTPDARTNTLIVMDVLENIAIAEQLVNKLDSQTPQVTIEARIVEARTNWLRELGIQWGFDFTATPGTGNPTGLWFPNSLGVAGGSAALGGQQITSGLLLPSAQATPNYVVDLPAAAGTGAGGAVGFSFGSVDGNLNTNLRLSAAEDVGEVRIISAPKISTLDNTTASIEQGVQIPISQVSAQGVNTRYVNATLGLSVTPHVTNEGSVMLEVQVQKNEADFVNTGARGDPTILTKSATSQMLVQDGDTAVIGGIFTRNQSVNRKKVPWISEIPIIGWFFKNKREADTRTEVLIFLTPKIINRST
ncbi:MAG: type IV pilus secretin PilQ, partial [Nannocystaceae bacterium]